MFCNHVAYNLAKAERRKLLFAVTEKKSVDSEKQLELKNVQVVFLVHNAQRGRRGKLTNRELFRVSKNEIM